MQALQDTGRADTQGLDPSEPKDKGYLSPGTPDTPVGSFHRMRGESPTRRGHRQLLVDTRAVVRPRSRHHPGCQVGREGSMWDMVQDVMWSYKAKWGKDMRQS